MHLEVVRDVALRRLVVDGVAAAWTSPALVRGVPKEGRRRLCILVRGARTVRRWWLGVLVAHGGRRRRGGKRTSWVPPDAVQRQVVGGRSRIATRRMTNSGGTPLCLGTPNREPSALHSWINDRDTAGAC